MKVPQSISDLRDLEIPRHRRVWKPFMQKYDCQNICELGVFEGENFKLMIEHNPKLAVAVDAWIDDGNIARHDSGYKQDTLDEMYKKFAVEMKDNPFVQIHREYTEDAAEHFPNDYFDLIYIDADHTFEGCLADIVAWYPKVKSGKFLTGDDYRQGHAPRTGVRFGVKEAVNKFAKDHALGVHELPRHGWAIIKP